jgi:cytochrome c
VSRLVARTAKRLSLPVALSLVAVALMSFAPWAQAADKDDAASALAAKSGCLTCHQVNAGGKGPDGLAPIGPAWRDVATKYRGQAGAEKQLTATVLAGSNPYESHWKGKVSGLAMPPNHVAISNADASKLVKWILALEPRS